MAESNIVIGDSSGDDGRLTISFEKKDFQEFISSLVSTPVEEVRAYEAGFDLSKQEIRVLVEKINYQVATNNELLNNEFSCTVYYKRRRKISYDNFSHFFATSYIGGGDVEAVDIVLSYLIGFNRSDKKSYEKQVVSIFFIAGA